MIIKGLLSLLVALFLGFGYLYYNLSVIKDDYRDCISKGKIMKMDLKTLDVELELSHEQCADKLRLQKKGKEVTKEVQDELEREDYKILATDGNITEEGELINEENIDEGDIHPSSVDHHNGM